LPIQTQFQAEGFPGAQRRRDLRSNLRTETCGELAGKILASLQVSERVNVSADNLAMSAAGAVRESTRRHRCEDGNLAQALASLADFS